MSDLNDPRNPNSPFNRYNYDSPWSIVNPTSPRYNPQAVVHDMGFYAAAGLVMLVLALPWAAWKMLVRVAAWNDGAVLGAGFWVILTSSQLFLILVGMTIVAEGRGALLWGDGRIWFFALTLLLNPVYGYYAVYRPLVGDSRGL